MKRRGKILLGITTLALVTAAAFVLIKIVRETVDPFSGAIVVLDDASWRNRYNAEEMYAYVWDKPDTILYRDESGDPRGGFPMIRRTLDAQGKASPPERLPHVSLTFEQHLNYSLSPDGKTLLTEEWTTDNSQTRWKYTLLPIAGGKPTVLFSDEHPLHWSPDSRFLLTVVFTRSGKSLLQQFDARTGKLTEISVGINQLTGVAHDGRLLEFGYAHWKLGKELRWWMKEVRNGQTVAQNHCQSPVAHATELLLSPNGDKLLWQVTNTEEDFWAKIQRNVFRRQTPPQTKIRWETTDLEGKHRRIIACYPLPANGSAVSVPQWTPDGTGIHFIRDEKLCFLAISK